MDWREHLRTAVSVSSGVDGASRVRARAGVLEAAPAAGVGAVVLAASEFLASDSNELRRRCCALLADVVDVLDGILTEDEAHHLVRAAGGGARRR